MRFRGPVGPKGHLQKNTGGPPDDRRFRPVGKRAYPERPSGTRDSASAAASWCRLSAGENHVQVQTSFVVAASSGMDFAGEGAIRAHRPQTDCRCRRQTLLLRATNLGNWMVPEGYMWLFQEGPQSPSEIRALVLELLGPEGSAAFWQKYRDSY